MKANSNLLVSACRKAKIPQKELKKISGHTKMNFIMEAMNHMLADINTKDSTLFNSMTANIDVSSDVDQLPAVVKRLMQKSGSFGMFFNYADPFIIYNGKAYSTGAFTADWKDCMEEYVAYKIGVERAGKAKNLITRKKRRGQPNKNLANVSTKLTAIRAAN